MNILPRERKQRFVDVNKNFDDFCNEKKHQPIWQIIILNIIMCTTGIICAQFKVSEDYRIAKTCLWIGVLLFSIPCQGGIFPLHPWFGWADTICVVTLMILYTITFLPLEPPWWCWLIAGLAIVMCCVYQYIRWFDKSNKLTVLGYIWLVNGWHTMVITTIICFYASTDF
tara:strand:- start:1649 stop:2158 length:510 start_codon:yes stop_codon:yes gene_type:complete